MKPPSYLVKKVLDRTNTIEFNVVNLNYNFDKAENKETSSSKIYSNDLLCSKEDEFIIICN